MADPMSNVLACTPIIKTKNVGRKLCSECRWSTCCDFSLNSTFVFTWKKIQEYILIKKQEERREGRCWFGGWRRALSPCLCIRLGKTDSRRHDCMQLSNSDTFNKLHTEDTKASICFNHLASFTYWTRNDELKIHPLTIESPPASSMCNFSCDISFTPTCACLFWPVDNLS